MVDTTSTLTPLHRKPGHQLLPLDNDLADPLTPPPAVTPKHAFDARHHFHVIRYSQFFEENKFFSATSTFLLLCTQNSETPSAPFP